MYRPADLGDWRVPYWPGWIMYWSAPICEFLGFDPERDKDLFFRVERAPDKILRSGFFERLAEAAKLESVLPPARKTMGGYLLQLTELPLDLSRDDHLRTYARALDRYPDIGGRTQRARKPALRGPIRLPRGGLSLELLAPPLGPRDARALELVRAQEVHSGPLRTHVNPRTRWWEDPPDRDEFVLSRTEAGIPWMYTPMVQVWGRLVGDPPQLFIRSTVFHEIDAAEFLTRFGDLFNAYWGRLVTHRDWMITDQQIEGRYDPEYPGLPLLKPLGHSADPRVPANLGWMNYFSPETAALLGFPDPKRDDSNAMDVRRTPRGAITFRLWEDWRHAEEPEVVEKLAAGYARFALIGGRAELGSAEPKSSPDE